MTLYHNNITWSVIRSLGDGHCLLYSLISAWKHQLLDKGLPAPDYNAVCCSLHHEVTKNPALYSPFLASQHELDWGLRLYLDHKKYNQTFGDIVPYILANIFGINIVILDELRDGRITEISVSPQKPSLHSLFIHKRFDHYNGLQIPMDSHHNYQVITSVVYSRADLLSLSNCKGKLPRIARKKLLRFGVWKGNIPASTPSDTLSLCCINTRSIRNKTGDFIDYVLSSNTHICAITETWLTAADDAIRSECTPCGYSFADHPRESNRQGGGTGILCKLPLTPQKVSAGEKTSFEFSEWIIKAPDVRFRIVVLYRPPQPASIFFEEFSTYLETVITCQEPLIITGDFNIHVDTPGNAEAGKFQDIIGNFGLNQIVTDQTHQSGHTLDLILTRHGDNMVTGTPMAKYFISDHAFVHCSLSFAQSNYLGKWITYRRLKNINTEDFIEDVYSSGLVNTSVTLSCSNDFQELVERYDTTLKTILNKHAPLKTKYVSIRPRAPWLTHEVKELKQQRRKRERQWRRNKSEETRIAFQESRNKCRAAINAAKNRFYSEKIYECEKDQKKLFHLVKSLLKPQPSPSLYCDLTPDGFGNFFVAKIDKIRQDLDSIDLPQVALPSTTSDIHASTQEFQHFQPLSEKEISQLVIKAPNKQCKTDPLPTWLLKSILGSLQPVLTQMVNFSFHLACFPDAWKEATITPLLKKPDLDMKYSNHRPVSNLTFVSKLVERAAVKQLSDHLLNNFPLPSFQSAYRSGYSTETALAKVHSDILLSMDQQELTLLVMLDLSAAFDTIDHKIMLETLQRDCRVCGRALDWFKSYLEGRKQQIIFKGELSKFYELKYGVPQGSCLGPVLFTIYAAPLFKIIEHHLVYIHGYADDHQLYTSFKPRSPLNLQDAIKKLEHCIADVRHWMLTNKLKINDTKTEVMVIGSRQQLTKVNINGIKIGNDVIKPVRSLRNLGVIMDENMRMDRHIGKVCKTAYYHLRNIRRIRPFLSKDAASILVHAFVSNQLDYCNALLYGLPKYMIDKLQHVQNTAVRVLLKLRKYDHITPSLQRLHWLPVCQRITFKICLLVFKALRGLAPGYIKNCLEVHQITQYQTRSTTRAIRLKIPRIKCLTFGGRALPSSGPKLWNNLPENLKLQTDYKQFKRQLKTHLFQTHFNI